MGTRLGWQGGLLVRPDHNYLLRFIAVEPAQRCRHHVSIPPPTFSPFSLLQDEDDLAGLEEAFATWQDRCSAGAAASTRLCPSLDGILSLAGGGPGSSARDYATAAAWIEDVAGTTACAGDGDAAGADGGPAVSYDYDAGPAVAPSASWAEGSGEPGPRVACLGQSPAEDGGVWGRTLRGRGEAQRCCVQEH